MNFRKEKPLWGEVTSGGALITENSKFFYPYVYKYIFLVEATLKKKYLECIYLYMHMCTPNTHVQILYTRTSI